VTDAELACIAVVQVLLPAGLWARVIQRLLALNVVIWLNWLIGAPVKRSLIPTIISP
jgi:hypothetical protein